MTLPRSCTYLLLCTACLALSACQSQGRYDDTPVDDVTVDSETPCLDSSCRVVSRLVDIPDAENLIFHSDGRLFVTGEFAYEIVPNGAAGFEAARIDDGSCGFPNEHLGLSIIGNTLYALCNNQVWAATIDDAMTLTPIHALNMGLPNGMTTDHAGRLYITDGPVTGTPQIQRVVIDPADPFNVLEQHLWTNDGLEFPNGITFDGSDFYIADASSNGAPGLVKKIALQADGSAGQPEVIYQHNSVLDDLDVFDDQSLIVSDFTNGRIFLINTSGDLLATSALAAVVAASAVVRGQAPMFTTNDILVTDKGGLGERNTSAGNALILFEPVADQP